MIFKQCAKEDRGGPLSWTILFLCFFSIVSDVMRCIPRVLEQNPKIGCFRSISRVSWNLLTLKEKQSREISSLVCAFLRRKTSLNFRLRKDAKERKKNVEQKTIGLLLLISAFNFQHNAPRDWSILINVMEKFPLSERRSMSKERSRYRKTDITNFSFLFAFGLQKYLSPTMQKWSAR